MRHTTLLGFLLLTGLLTGCLRDPDPIDLDEDAVTVHAILEAGADSAVILLSRPGDNAAYGSWTPYTPIADAEVRLIAGGETTWLIEDPDVPCVYAYYSDPSGTGSGCYRAVLPEPIAAGTEYHLEIELTDGTAIHGRTTVPEPVTIRAPDPGATVTATCDSDESCWGQPLDVPPYAIPVVTIPVAWTSNASIHGSSVSLRPVAVYHQGVEYPGTACDLGYYGSLPISRDSLDWLVPNIYCSGEDGNLSMARFDSIRARLSVIGLNEHYTRYQETTYGQGVRIEAASQGLDGAYGVFGATSTATRTILIIRAP